MEKFRVYMKTGPVQILIEEEFKNLDPSTWTASQPASLEVPPMLEPEFYSPGIPGDLLNKLHRSLIADAPHGFLRDQLTSALMGVAYRHRSAYESYGSLTASLISNGHAPPQNVRFEQDRDLCHFIFDGQSCVECVAYAAYFIGARLNPARFSRAAPGSLKGITVSEAAKTWDGVYPSDQISVALIETSKSLTWKKWNDCRNILAHRCQPGRDFAELVGAVAPHSSATQRETEIPLSAADLEEYLTWLNSVVSSVVTSVWCSNALNLQATT